MVHDIPVYTLFRVNSLIRIKTIFNWLIPLEWMNFSAQEGILYFQSLRSRVIGASMRGRRSNLVHDFRQGTDARRSGISPPWKSINTGITEGVTVSLSRVWAVIFYMTEFYKPNSCLINNIKNLWQPQSRIALLFHRRRIFRHGSLKFFEPLCSLRYSARGISAYGGSVRRNILIFLYIEYSGYWIPLSRIILTFILLSFHA